MLFRQLFDRTSCTYTYLLADPETREAILIDPVVECMDRDLEILEQLDLKLIATVETHVHADHITSACRLREKLGCKVILPAVAGVEAADVGVGAGDSITFGKYALEVRPTPGHTDACTTYVCHEAGMVFTGDTLFIRGCGRTDFQSGDSRTLYASVHNQIFSLPGETTVYPGHDYRGRTSSTVSEEIAHNPRLGGGNTVEQFVEIMNNLNLANPKMIDIALPANLMAGGCAAS